MSQLIIFLSIYFAVYGAPHLYLMIKLRRAYYLHGLKYGLLSLLLLFFMLAPIQAQILEAQGLILLSTIVEWTGYIWMGFIFIFTCLSLPMDGYHLLIAFGQHITGSDLTHLMLSRRQSVAVTAILTTCFIAYGAHEASQLQVETVTIESTKIPLSRGRIRIAQISDMHLGAMHYPGRLEAVATAVKAAQPDLLVSTGDLVDGRIRGRSNAVKLLSTIPAPLGKFAVTGNHEFYRRTGEAIQFTQAAGFTILQNRSLSVDNILTVVGVDDPAAGSSYSSTTEGALLAKTTGRRFTLLLKHRPTIISENKHRFDLQLSGHTHKGQIFPFSLLIQLRYPRYHGLHQLRSDAKLYVSRGTGTWGPPVRLLAPPEVTIIDLVPVQKGTAKQ